MLPLVLRPLIFLPNICLLVYRLLMTSWYHEPFICCTYYQANMCTKDLSVEFKLFWQNNHDSDRINKLTQLNQKMLFWTKNKLNPCSMEILHENSQNYVFRYPKITLLVHFNNIEEISSVCLHKLFQLLPLHSNHTECFLFEAGNKGACLPFHSLAPR